MRAKRWMLLGMSLLAFAACKSKSKSEAGSGTGTGGQNAGTGSGTATATADAAPAAAAPDAAAAASGDLAVRADGVGPLDGKMEVTADSLAAALPGYKIDKVTTPHGGDLEEEYYSVAKDDKVVLHVQFTGTTLSAVDVVAPGLANPFGIDVGMTYADVVAKVGELDCANAGDEVDWRSDVVVCTTDKAANYTLDFVGAEGEGLSAADLLEDPDQLGNATLRALTWQAETGMPGQ